VIYTAHYDTGNHPNVTGDNIYTARSEQWHRLRHFWLELARAWSLRRPAQLGSILFAAVTAEGRVCLGPEYLGKALACARGKISVI